MSAIDTLLVSVGLNAVSQILTRLEGLQVEPILKSDCC